MQKPSNPRLSIARAAAVILAALIVIGIAGASQQSPDWLSAVAILCSLLAAALLVGGILGFLFGMPRYREPTADARTYQPSTNLEQVSDWLTKILIGVGIAEASSFFTAGNSFLEDQVVPALEGAPGAYVTSLSIIASGAVLGFLLGWLATRFYLTRALVDFERDILSIADALSQTNPEVADELRSVAAEATAPSPDTTMTAAKFETDVLASLTNAAQERNWTVQAGPAARPWDGRLTDGDGRTWGIEVRFSAADLRSSTIRFIAGRVITATDELAGAIVLSNQALTRTAAREADAFTQRGATIIAVPLPQGPTDTAIGSALDTLPPPAPSPAVQDHAGS